MSGTPAAHNSNLKRALCQLKSNTHNPGTQCFSMGAHPTLGSQAHGGGALAAHPSVAPRGGPGRPACRQQLRHTIHAHPAPHAGHAQPVITAAVQGYAQWTHTCYGLQSCYGLAPPQCVEYTRGAGRKGHPTTHHPTKVVSAQLTRNRRSQMMMSLRRHMIINLDRQLATCQTCGADQPLSRYNELLAAALLAAPITSRAGVALPPQSV